MPLTVRGVIRLAMLLASSWAAAGARADATISADIGWGGRTRAGRWTPIYVTVSDSKPRNAVIELYSPHDATQAMSIHVPIAIGPLPQMYALMVPLLNSGEPTRLSLLDASTGKLIKDATIVDTFGMSEDGSRQNPFTQYTGPFIGISGVGPALAALEQGTDSPTVAFLQKERLPRTFRGYDALDLLVLNQPDLVGMESAQQTAIRDWVEAGGKLLLWPGENPLPPSGPLVGILPGKVGDVITVKVLPAVVKSAGLPERFANFTARSITPDAHAKVTKLLGDGGGVAVTGYAGLGKVTLVNFNVSALLFNNSELQQRFFREFLPIAAKATVNTAEVHSADEAKAAGQLMDLMGDIPGVGTFGFGYVAAVMLGMMAIVGPIDWFVLKWMRRQPWTWVTTAGWIGLITIIALSLGTLMRSGELHFRTVSLIDQVGDRAVARMNTLGLYSPRTTEYRFDVHPGSWWEPMTTDMYNYSREVIRPLPFQQDENSNRPLEDTVHVWNLRFLMGETAGKSEPVLGADLQITPAPRGQTTQPASARTPRHVKGRITNLSNVVLPNLWLRTKLGLFDLTKEKGFPAGGLAPAGRLQIDIALQTNAAAYVGWAGTASQTKNYGRYGEPVGNGPPNTPLAIMRAAGDLPSDRSRSIDERIDAGTPGATWAVIYAEAETPDGAAKLIAEQPKTRNWQVFRALVQLKDAEPQSR